jgi:hypothetical protein
MPARTSPPHADRTARDAAGPRRARFLVATAVAGLVLSIAPVAALAQSTSVDPATYVHSVCTTLSSYSGQVTALQSSTDLSNATSLTDVRDKLVSFLGQVRSASSTALTALQNAGAPNIKNGSKIAAVIVREVSALGDAFTKAENLAQKLSTTSLSSFKRGIAAITKLEKSAGQQATKVLASARGRYPSLKSAGKSDPACQGLK